MLIKKILNSHSALFLVFIFFLLYLNMAFVPGQERIQEAATVMAVEVPVRVIQKGQTIKNPPKNRTFILIITIFWFILPRIANQPRNETLKLRLIRRESTSFT